MKCFICEKTIKDADRIHLLKNNKYCDTCYNIRLKISKIIRYTILKFNISGKQILNKTDIENFNKTCWPSRSNFAKNKGLPFTTRYIEILIDRFRCENMKSAKEFLVRIQKK